MMCLQWKLLSRHPPPSGMVCQSGSEERQIFDLELLAFGMLTTLVSVIDLHTTLEGGGG